MMEVNMTKNTDPNDELHIEIGEELPEQAASTPAPAPSKPALDGADDDDLSQYGEKVQKRIGKLVFDRNEERRKREEAARLQEEAIRYAEIVARENAELKKRVSEGQTSALAESKARLDAELANQRAVFKQAYEAGDADGVTEAQFKIAELTARKSQLDMAAAQQAARPAPAPTAPPQPARPAVPKPDPAAQAWASRNTWFGSDEVMTGFAFGVHEQLVRSGVDPRSDVYYSRIDEAVRAKFPEKFETPGQDVTIQPRTPGNVVAPASRDAKAPRTVRLTPSAAALAKRLGLTPEQYAAQVLKERQNG
jgi:hypothetical protein